MPKPTEVHPRVKELADEAFMEYIRGDKFHVAVANALDKMRLEERANVVAKIKAAQEAARKGT